MFGFKMNTWWHDGDLLLTFIIGTGSCSPLFSGARPLSRKSGSFIKQPFAPPKKRCQRKENISWQCSAVVIQTILLARKLEAFHTSLLMEFCSPSFGWFWSNVPASWNEALTDWAKSLRFPLKTNSISSMRISSSHLSGQRRRWGESASKMMRDSVEDEERVREMKGGRV